MNAKGEKHMRTQLMHVSFDLLLKNNDELADEGEKKKNKN